MRFLYVSFASLYIIISIIVLCIIIWQRILPETHFSIWVNNTGGHFHPNVNMLYYMYFFILVSFYTPRKPQEIRKPEVFCFPVVQKDSTDIKWVKWFHDLRHSHNQQYILKPLLTGTPFLADVPILYPPKTPENQRFSGVFGGYKMGTLPKNTLNPFDFTTLSFLLQNNIYAWEWNLRIGRSIEYVCFYLQYMQRDFVRKIMVVSIYHFQY